MASRRIPTPMRGVASQLGRLSIIRREAAISTTFARGITTSPSPRASIPTITTSVNQPGPVLPLEQRTVTATIHHFPSLEPLRFETYPANHLDLPTRRDILHRAVIYEGDNTRRGTASTKTRYEVRGSARKIRPQKGSGKARLGDKKSPMLRGGGVAFGPKPRDFGTELQTKVYDLAFRTALSYRFRKGELVIVDNAMEIESPSTTLLKNIFAHNGWGDKNGRSILVTVQERPLLSRALADAPNQGWTSTWDGVDVKDMLSLGRIVIERQALRNILLSHQEDLVRKSFRPKLTQSLEPEELNQVLGWWEFQKLESVSPEERAELAPGYYEEVAEARIAQAEQSNDTPMLISAYHLKSEARRLQSEALSTHEDLQYEESEDEGELLRAYKRRIEVLGLQAERSELKADALRLEGKEELAAEWDADAAYYREQADEKQEWIDTTFGSEEAEAEEAAEEQRK
jgi:large subunit ribosomal protein L4